ncbi:efflux RND transporter periplasmic adaptor subunit [Bradyrhizobium sp. PUT101]|uniref:efflux RND transporter periplasmic adaptor subunit n=1 Tax=Bradyrhizobium sp. PUT101 TaxID=3447427 RepID=UPI003F8463E3
MTYQFRNPNILLAIVAALGLAGCGRPQSDETSAQGGAPSALVTVLSVKPETVVLVDELPGRVTAFRTAEIRPQVGGILEKRLFDQGAEVEAGQALFQINSDIFQADVGSAAAALQRVEAGLVRSQGKFDRAKQLVTSNAISREAYDDAAADVAQAKANVAEAQATLRRKQLDLAFTTVRAPIAGRSGRALVSEGALASVSSTNALATIQQIDRVYVDVRQPASQIDAIREAAQSGHLDDASKVPVTIFAASGKPYPVKGRALFSDISVDPGTGNVTVRVEVPNPDRLLLPGMYVRARMPRGVGHNALLVPQEAVVRDPAGTPQLVIVDDHKRATRRAVALGEIVDRRYIVTSGLQAGEIVVVQGQERAKNGAVVETAPFGAAAAAVTD